MLRKMFVLSASVLALSGVVMQSAESQRGWGWAQRLPVSQFSTEDAAIFHAHVDRALDEAADGEGVDWHNPDSGTSGVITPLSTEQLNGMVCRNTRFESQVGQTQNVSEYLLCQQPGGGVWSVQSR